MKTQTITYNETKRGGVVTMEKFSDNKNKRVRSSFFILHQFLARISGKNKDLPLFVFDCVTDTHAIEFDFGNNWTEAINWRIC
jgi:hypothetical protein